ncbi:MAG: DUF3052 domain-containing protein [Gordonia sp. (in: high G+C Gram-positive bacteria)]|uniref:DUF3052 domain-containing protein n=1 Tax=Gordonia sp. (in: high G+C Gram-positive bacteria) TaxID=84139 RepID=UPI0039E398FE
MVSTTDEGNVGKLGFTHGMVIQELGWDDDTDDELRVAIEDVIDAEMLDDDAVEVMDAVLLWWRDGDGDLVDALVDAIGPLAEGGFIWVVSPKTGKSGYVDPSEIAEAAPTAGLSQTKVVNLGDWSGSRLESRPRGKR